MPYLSASAVVIHYEEALYQVYAPLPLPRSIKRTNRFNRAQRPLLKSKLNGLSSYFQISENLTPKWSIAIRGDCVTDNDRGGFTDKIDAYLISLHTKPALTAVEDLFGFLTYFSLVRCQSTAVCGVGLSCFTIACLLINERLAVSSLRYSRRYFLYQVRWLGLRVDGRLCAVLQFIKWTEWTLAMACGHEDSTINIVLVLLLLFFTCFGMLAI